jgi:GDP-L-fucose synthase
VLIPANLYGINDCFDAYNSHVIPAMLLKFHKAKLNNEEVILWGSGRAIRDFVYVEDIANMMPHFIENDIKFISDLPCMETVCNLSSGIGCSIKELAEIIIDVVGYKGKVSWDTTKPEGPLNKVFDNRRMQSLGLSCPTSIREGIEKTYRWFVQQY